MKQLNLLVVFYTLMIMLTGCDAVANIFKAGIMVYAFLGIVIIAVIIFVISRFSGKK